MDQLSPELAGASDVAWRLVLVALPGAVFAVIYALGITRIAPVEVRGIVAAVRSKVPNRS